jgi:hypothetical protein
MSIEARHPCFEPEVGSFRNFLCAESALTRELGPGWLSRLRGRHGATVPILPAPHPFGVHFFALPMDGYT